MTDRELLEAAARAADMNYLIWTPGAAPIVPGEHRVCADHGYWNPLTDDGDALRLAAKLELSILPGGGNVEVSAYEGMKELEDGEMFYPWCQEHYGPDRCAATRRAIVRTAAAMNKEPS